MKDLAVIVPSFNGGARLRQSVESCAASGLSPERYGLLIIDNCSTDGSIDALPEHDSNGVPVQVYRNDRNLGRVGNWNRGLEIAECEGYRFASFLFVGDTWAAAGSLEQLLDEMQQKDAVLGMACLKIVEETTSRSRHGARISIPGKSAIVNSRSLLEHVIRIGRLPFAPIQANVYRLFKERPLRFDEDPARSLNTDIEATVMWLQQHPGRIILMSDPFLVWSGHADRFFNKQDPWFVLVETRSSLMRLSQATGLAVDWESANAVSLLTSARELSARTPLGPRLLFLFRVVRYLRTVPGGLALRKFFQFSTRKLLRNQSYLSLTVGSALLLDSPAPTRAANEALLTRVGL